MYTFFFIQCSLVRCRARCPAIFINCRFFIETHLALPAILRPLKVPFFCCRLAPSAPYGTVPQSYLQPAFRPVFQFCIRSVHASFFQERTETFYSETLCLRHLIKLISGAYCFFLSVIHMLQKKFRYRHINAADRFLLLCKGIVKETKPFCFQIHIYTFRFKQKEPFFKKVSGHTSQ